MDVSSGEEQEHITSDLNQVPRGTVFFRHMLWVPFNSQVRNQILLKPRIVLDGFLAWDSWTVTKEQDCEEQ